AEKLPHLGRRERKLGGDLLGPGLAPELLEEFALGPDDLVQPLDDLRGKADRARLVDQRPPQRLSDPPARVGREPETPPPVVLLDRADQPQRALLDQVEKRQPLATV